MANLESMIEKRHPAPGWQVMWEVSNGTGYRREVRYADAIAFGIWPSHGNELHGFEIKRSREDLKKELSDPSKGDAIGRYVDYWWLVLDDIKLCEGIVIPATWGILAPRGQVLKVHRKAPKRKATPIDRSFAAAMIRRVTEHWVPKQVHEDYKRDAETKARATVAAEFARKREDAESRLEELTEQIEQFEKITGVEITRRRLEYGEGGEPKPVMLPLYGTHIKNIGEIVKLVIDVREQHRYWGTGETAAEIIRRELDQTERYIDQHERALQQRQATKTRLEKQLAELERQTAAAPSPEWEGQPPTSSESDTERSS